MKDSIGSYLRLKLRSKNISNKDAGISIGLSESAFEKILTQDDIYASRLVKLSELLQENLFEYYYSNGALKNLVETEQNIQKKSALVLTDKINLQEQLITSKEELLENQRKYILELESRLNDKK